VLIDPGIGWSRLGACLGEAAPELFVGSPKAQLARLLGRWAPTARMSVTCGRPALSKATPEGLRELGRGYALDFPKLSPGDRAAILFTSGSTGAPKGAVYEHGMFASQLEQLRSLFGIREGDVSVATFPLFALFDLALGQTVLLPRMDFTRPGSVDPMEIVMAVQRHGAKQLFGSPALIERVGRFGERHGILLPSLERVMSAGAPVPSRTLARFQKLLRPEVPIYTPYGATEALPVALTDSREILGETAAATARGEGVCRPARRGRSR
jgi:acyl-coenzyme A synthetase/AMP-(fatty) acid ligase